MATRAAPLNAFVLHHYDWSETSLILDVFTREQGRLAVAAKGAKRPYSQFRSVLLPFQRILMSLGRTPPGESEVHNLRGAEWAGGPPMLSGAALFSGFYLNELLMKLLARQDPHPTLFDAYAATLPQLAGDDDPRAQAALRAFELTLLREIGLLPDLSVVTLTQQPVQPHGVYDLHPEAGVVANGDGGVSGATLLALQAAQDAGQHERLSAACGTALAPLKLTLRNLLHYHLGSPLLRTRQVMLDVQKLIEP
ncbi:MAG TPA: DNA repair protein RecO [Burkholderiaceae bacterium]|nr:DNA repair protein RecO [Burkholderiaceae bacterium]